MLEVESWGFGGGGVEHLVESRVQEAFHLEVRLGHPPCPKQLTAPDR
jgi:hypothetical protein